MSNIDRIRKELPEARRLKVERRAATLISKERALAALRHSRKKTQSQIGASLGVGQDSVSRLEARSDVLISTLRTYVEALGGRLTLLAEFPDQEPVVLSFQPSLAAERKSPASSKVKSSSARSRG